MEIKYKVKENFYKDTNKQVLELSLKEIEKSNITTYSEFYKGSDFVKPYFDFDISNVKDKNIYNKTRNKIKNDYYEIIKDTFEDSLNDNFTNDTRKEIINNIDIAISESSYYNAENDNKISIHFVVCGLNLKASEIVPYCNDYNYTEDKIPFFEYFEGLDTSVYRAEDKTGNMRMININKPNKKTKLKPVNYKDDITKHIIQHLIDGSTEYNKIVIDWKATEKKNNENIINEKSLLYEKNNKDIYHLDDYEKRFLYIIDPNQYYSWFRVCIILRSLNCNMSVFLNWSSTSPKYKMLENEKLWNNCKIVETVGIGSLYFMANSEKYGNPAEYKNIIEKKNYNKTEKKNKELYKFVIPESEIKKLLENCDNDDIDINNIESLINASNYDMKDELVNYYKYKPILENIIEPDKKINVKKLDIMENNKVIKNIIDECPNKKYIIIKSDTGTGKTTSMLNYFEKEQEQNKFLSVVSRISLGESQYKLIIDRDIRIRMYNKHKLVNEDNIIIQLDSICNKLYKIDYTKYVIYLDEFSSILEHLHNSTTLNDKRVGVYKRFLKILRNCKKCVMVDADIDDICIRFIKALSNDVYFIENTYLNNKGVEADEVENYEDIINKMKDDISKDGFCCCCDSKNVATDVYNNLIQDNPEFKDQILLITDEYVGYIDMDSVKCIIYSPKVIYGIDSTIKRNVYCIYKEHTISPKAMYQQISRTRDIKHLYYYFQKKKFQYGWYANLKEIENEFNEALDYCKDIVEFEDEDNFTKNLYCDTLKYYKWNEDAYKTNKFSHLLNILENKGVIHKNQVLKLNNKKVFLEYQKAQRQLTLNNFDPDNIFVKKQNEKFLKMTQEEVIKYKELFLDNYKLSAHFYFCKYFFKDIDFVDEVQKVKDFNINKISSSVYKLYFLNKIQNLFNLKKNNISIDIKQNYNLSYSQLKNLDNEYNIIFKLKDKNATFTNPQGVNSIIAKMFRSCFGGDSLITTRKQINKVRTYQYSFNDKYFEYHMNIYNIRKVLYNQRVQEQQNSINPKIKYFDWIKDKFIPEEVFYDTDEEEYNILDK